MNTWESREIRRLYKAYHDKNRRLSLFRERQASGVNPVNGMADSDLLFIAQIETDAARLAYEMHKAVLEKDWPRLPAILTGLYAVQGRLTAWDTNSPAVRSNLAQRKAQVDALINTLLACMVDHKAAAEYSTPPLDAA